MPVHRTNTREQKPVMGARAGHIPGARNVFWMENLASKDNPVLKTAPEMLASTKRLA